MLRNRILLTFVVAAALNVIACWSIAVWSEPSAGRVLVSSEAEEQLDFVFGGDHQWRQDETYRPRGTTHSGRLIRRAYVAGWTTEASPRRFSELVLKIGWPFTTVRGFVRRRGLEIDYEGSVSLRENRGEPDQEKILPLQIVWPGFVFNSALLAALIIGIIQLVGRGRLAL